MSSRRSMTRDIHESIRLLLGKNVKVLLKSFVKLELKSGGDKTENRVLVFTAHRMFVVFHYLDLRGVESRRLNHIAFTFGIGSDKVHTLTFRLATEAESDSSIDDMIYALVGAVKRIFPGVPVERVIGQVIVQPADRKVSNCLVWSDPDSKTVGPCGGFSAQYACMCDYFSLPFREEVAWDVDTIYFSHDSHEMCLQDFEHLDHRDLLCIVSALEHNTWFTKLKAGGTSNSKISSDMCDRLLHVVGKSPSLQELHVPSIGARWEFAGKLSQAITANPSSSLTSFDLSYNFLEDKGINQLSAVLSKHSKGLRHVNLSYCSLTGKGLTSFCAALSASTVNGSTLTYLNLAGNLMKEESYSLCTFLAQPNVVAILDISSTETPLDVLFGALVRGCTSHLTHLNLSRNPFHSKKSKEVPAAFKQFFAGTLALQYVNLSHCKIPPEAVKNLLLGLACNEATTNVELNLSCNNLSAQGAVVIESCMSGVKCISRLDLSDNGIDGEMAGVMQGITKNKSILSLNVSRNMTGVKQKHLAAVMESIVQLIQDEETVLQKLNLSDCKLKAEINNVINALGSNQCLQHLDISGNQMGDVGARLLAKALQINTRLRIINLDRNGITLQGYTDITYALQSNYSMRHIPFPTFDLQPFIKTHPDRVDAIVHRMQELLHRNSTPHRFRNTAQAFRLTQGFLLSSTQQILDRSSASAQDNIDTLVKLSPDRESQEEVRLTKGFIEDAENAKHLLSALHEVTARGNEVDLKLKQVSLELGNFVATHIHQNVEAMLGCAEKQCPRVLARTKSELRSMCQRKCHIPPDFMSGLVMDQLGQEVHNKINELNLIIANHVSDKVIDEVIEGLTSSARTLSSEAANCRKTRSLTPDVLKGRSSSLSESVEHETSSMTSGDASSQKSEPSPIGTPQTSKRKSLQGRKLRPKSVADAKDDDVTADESVLNNASRTTPHEEDVVPELPSTVVLQHLGKARPKRSKKYAPTRGAVVLQHHVADSPDGVNEEDEIKKFYSPPSSSYNNSFNSSFSPGSTPSDSPRLTDEDKEATIEKMDEKRSASFLPKRGEDKRQAVSSPEHGKPTGDKHHHHSASRLVSGLSCLTGATMDEEAKSSESPEKRSLSPSLHSISELFSKKGQHTDAKQASPKPETKPISSPSGISPFASRKTDTDLLPSGPRRIPAQKEDNEASRTLSPEGSDGKRTPEGGMKRVGGIGHGGNADLLAEMKEKRASMVPKTTTEGELSPTKGQSSSTSDQPRGQSSLTSDPTKNIFGHVKLRSTGLAGTLNSPTTEASSDSEKLEGTVKGSIVGLRSAKFSPYSLTSGTGGAQSNASSSTSSTSTSDLAPKPKPLPKPRPWSIVGVDRKSGELTSVSTSTNNSQATNDASGSGARKSSVRDMINSMNKSESANAAATSTLSTSANMGSDISSKRKGNSLPRGVPPLGASNSAEESGQSARSGTSPKVTKRSDSTSDDPRILKLDDDFPYDDVLDV